MTIVASRPAIEADGNATRPSPTRLVRQTVELASGQRVRVATAGAGIPLVCIHGFLADGLVYAQSWRRLADQGFRVIAIDIAGHGGSPSLHQGWHRLSAYAELVRETVDHLGIEQMVLIGHSMGGRLVCEVARGMLRDDDAQADRILGLILIDAIVGDTWDRLARAGRAFPPLWLGFGGMLIADLATTFPMASNPAQARKLLRLLGPAIVGHVRQPWRLAGPSTSLVLAGATAPMLDAIGAADVPVAVVHGDLDFAVPLAAARESARRVAGDLVVVRHGHHSWLLRDPESLPSIVDELFARRFGTRVARRIYPSSTDERSERRPRRASPPAPPKRTDVAPPRYRWTIESMPSNGTHDSPRVPARDSHSPRLGR